MVSCDLDIDYLDDKLYEKICNGILSGDFSYLDNFINDFGNYSDWDFTDALVERVKELCRFLIDNKAYGYLSQIGKICYIFFTYDDKQIESESVLNYAICKMPDDDVCTLIDSINFGRNVACFFECTMPSEVAVNCNKYHTLKKLFEREIACEKFGYGKITLLQYAVYKADLQTAWFALTELKHNVNYCGNYGITPLALAVEEERFEMVEFLLDWGANPAYCGENGRQLRDFVRSPKMVEFLQNHGVDCCDDETPPKL